jgi:hypothetical protein
MWSLINIFNLILPCSIFVDLVVNFFQDETSKKTPPTCVGGSIDSGVEDCNAFFYIRTWTPVDSQGIG